MYHKLLPALAACTLITSSLFAQTTHWPGKVANPSSNARLAKQVKTVHALNASETAAKTTGTEQRLLATGNYSSNGVGLDFSDSTRYKYSGLHTSKFNFDDLYYNEYLYLPDPIGQPYVGFDSLFRYDDMMQLSDVLVTKRNSANQPLMQLSPMQYGVSWDYDAQGRVVVAHNFYYDNSTMQWDTTYRDYYRYDAAGRVIVDSSVSNNSSVWEPDYKSEFSYNAAGQPILVKSYSWNGSSFDESDRATITYASTTGFQFQRMTYEYFNGSTWEFMAKDTFGYSNVMLNLYRSYEWDGSMWNLIGEEVRHLNSNGLPDSVFSRQYQGWTSTWDTSISKLQYNSFNNPTRLTYFYSGNIGGLVPDYQNLYYYEEFQTGSGVGDKTKPKALTLYPNPATNKLLVKMDQSGQYQCTIFNSLGQSLLQIKGTVSAGQAVSLPVQQLTPGQYMLHMQDNAGTQYTGTFIKQ